MQKFFIVICALCLFTTNATFASQGMSEDEKIRHYAEVCNYADLYESVFIDFENLDYVVTRREVISVIANITWQGGVKWIVNDDSINFENLMFNTEFADISDKESDDFKIVAIAYYKGYFLGKIDADGNRYAALDEPVTYKELSLMLLRVYSTSMYRNSSWIENEMDIKSEAEGLGIYFQDKENDNVLLGDFITIMYNALFENYIDYNYKTTHLYEELLYNKLEYN